MFSDWLSWQTWRIILKIRLVQRYFGLKSIFLVMADGSATSLLIPRVRLGSAALEDTHAPILQRNTTCCLTIG